jgi:flagellar biosynthesis/type III secretory pathway protein FliH
VTWGYFEHFVQKGRDEGLQKGRDEGQRQLLLMLLEQRFGPLAPYVRERVEPMSEDQRIELAKALVHAQSLRALGLED